MDRGYKKFLANLGGFAVISEALVYVKFNYARTRSLGENFSPFGTDHSKVEFFDLVSGYGAS